MKKGHIPIFEFRRQDSIAAQQQHNNPPRRPRQRGRPGGLRRRRRRGGQQGRPGVCRCRWGLKHTHTTIAEYSSALEAAVEGHRRWPWGLPIHSARDAGTWGGA